MIPLEPRQREVLQIVLAASVGDATDEQLARLSQLVVEDESLAQFAVQLLSQEAWLSWHGSQAQADRLLAELASHSLETAPASADSASAPSVRLESAATRAALEEGSSPEGVATVRPAAARIDPFSGRRSWLVPGVSAAVLVAIGALIGALATRWGFQTGQERVVAVDAMSSGTESEASSHPPSRYVARFVQGTACVWEPGRVPPPVQDGNLRSGESFNLMEGLAEIEVSFATAGSATLQMEGPARMILTAEGTPSLTLGKFSARVSPRFSDIALDTPFGQIRVLEDSSLGVAVHGLEVEVHVFLGQVAVASPWTLDGNSVDRFRISAGESLRLSVAESEAMKFTRGVAEPERFATQMTMVSDRLEITDQYVREIVRASPIIYWRFEGAREGVIRNEVGDRFDGAVVGALKWSVQGNNRAVEFDSDLTDEALRAYVETNDTLGRAITDSYSVEVWVKPSHYHLGSLVSFFRHPAASHDPGLHGTLLELGGPLTTPSTIEHPGRIRFLHRDPPSDDAYLGTSCFSNSPYELRRWTYLAAVKDGPEMRLYVNGQQVASADDNTKLAEDLTVLIGQLDRHRHWRRFVGQLDELAIYDRALSDGEIRRHFELVRPKKSSREAI